MALTEVLDLDLDDVADTDKRQLYITASEMITVRDLGDYFRSNPQLAAFVRNAAAGLPAGEAARAAKVAVAQYFDREMEQLSTLYQRQSRKVLAILAVGVVLFFQANSLGIISDLRNDSAFREASRQQCRRHSERADVGAGGRATVRAGDREHATGANDHHRPVQGRRREVRLRRQDRRGRQVAQPAARSRRGRNATIPGRSATDGTTSPLAMDCWAERSPCCPDVRIPVLVRHPATDGGSDENRCRRVDPARAETCVPP